MAEGGYALFLQTRSGAAWWTNRRFSLPTDVVGNM